MNVARNSVFSIFRRFQSSSTSTDLYERAAARLNAGGPRKKYYAPGQIAQDRPVYQSFQVKESKEDLFRLQRTHFSFLKTVDPYTSRTKPVYDGNVVHALRLINSTRKANNVLGEGRLRLRYEKPHLKAYRLRSERHRRRFKATVGKFVALAKRLTAKGF